MVRSKNKHFKIEPKTPWFKIDLFDGMADFAVRKYENIRINILLKEKEKIVSKQNRLSESYSLLNENENLGKVIQNLELQQVRGEILFVPNSKGEVQEIYVPIEV